MLFWFDFLILSFLFFFVILSNLFIILVTEKIRVKLTPAIPTGVPTILTDEKIQTPPLVALKTIKTIYVIKSNNIFP